MPCSKFEQIKQITERPINQSTRAERSFVMNHLGSCAECNHWFHHVRTRPSTMLTISQLADMYVGDIKDPEYDTKVSRHS